MMLACDRVQPIGRDDLIFPFNGEPYFETRPREGGYVNQHYVNPFPAYAHDPKLVADIATSVEAMFPIGFPPQYLLPEFEGRECLNGVCKKLLGRYENGKYESWEPCIILWGKRIPPHPAMTRYLVAHEYGHAVQDWIEHARGADANKSISDSDREYGVLRNVEPVARGATGGKWHSDIGELFANDFRILVCNVETEFWPHPGFERPEAIPGLREWWDRALEKLVHKPADLPVSGHAGVIPGD